MAQQQNADRRKSVNLKTDQYNLYILNNEEKYWKK